MRIILTFVIIFCNAGIVTAQGNDQNSTNDSDSTFVQIFWPTGQVASEGIMKGGQPDGYWRTYYVTGVLKSEGKRTNYLLDSIWNFYNQSGELVQSISYQVGEKNGYSITYRYDNPKKPGRATMISKELYVKGKREGNSYYYFPTGELKEVVYYKENRKNGIAKEYSTDSVLITVEEYNNNYMIDRERVNRTDAQGKKQGTFREYYANGKMKTEAHYLDDQLHGYYREFDGSGDLVLALRYERGKIMEEIDEDLKELLDMKSTYDEKGRILFTGGYKDGVPVGIHRFYDTTGIVENAYLYNEMGQKISEGIIDEQGNRKGEWKDFFGTGAIRAEGYYQDNLKNGKWTYFYQSGSIEQKGSFERGRYQGLWMWYYTNGNIWREENYFNGREDGMFTEYDETGNILTQGNYISGEKDGEWFYHVGDHEEKGSYVIGLREGIWKYYYSNGTLEYEGSYSQGNPDKKHKYYYPSGVLKEEQYYQMGIREKNWKKYDPEGNLVMTITYRNDIEQRINGIRIGLPESEITLIR
jgi:antitoxin component YwqK of YwqJK toxin-antitoxin module